MAGQLYPINLLLGGRRCLVVGGQSVALGKTEELVRCGAEVQVVAPSICGELSELASGSAPAAAATAAAVGSLTLHERKYAPDDLDGCFLVVAATGDAAVNQQVYDDARARGILVNSADDPQRCDFFLPARVRRGDLLVTVSTGGQSPAMASWLKRRLDGELSAEVEQMFLLVAEVRQEIRGRGIATEPLNWAEALDDGILELVEAGRLEQAKQQLKDRLLPD